MNPWDRTAGAELFEAALVHAFEDMNAGLLAFDDLEFPTSNPRKVGGFLARFDAIFTLNQDLLLEHRYMRRVSGLSHPGGQWTGAQLPGLQEIPRADGKAASSWVDRFWTDSGNTQVDPAQQPIIKLHGSTNWRTADGKNVLIFGAAKAQAISNNRLLQSYGTLFEAALCDPAAKLMVIGYGFGDSHITDAIEKGAERGLSMFLIDPLGSDLARERNRTRKQAVIVDKTREERLFERCLVGCSRRSLREIFLGDMVEIGKVERFLESSR